MRRYQADTTMLNLEKKVKNSPFLNGLDWLIRAFCKFIGLMVCITVIFMICFVLFGTSP